MHTKGSVQVRETPFMFCNYDSF